MYAAAAALAVQAAPLLAEPMPCLHALQPRRCACPLIGRRSGRWVCSVRNGQRVRAHLRFACVGVKWGGLLVRVKVQVRWRGWEFGEVGWRVKQGVEPPARITQICSWGGRGGSKSSSRGTLFRCMRSLWGTVIGWVPQEKSLSRVGESCVSWAGSCTCVEAACVGVHRHTSTELQGEPHKGALLGEMGVWGALWKEI